MKILISLVSLWGILFSHYAYSENEMFEDYILKTLQLWDIPGASIAIVKDNKVILAKGFGYKKLDKTKINEINADTLFPIASLTKSFAAVAGGIFAQQQGLSWDSTIHSLWPSFKLSDAYATKNLTIRDCLSMRAGLTGPSLEDSWWLQTSLSEENLLKELSKLSFPCGFRGCFAYQNFLYSIMGHVIEKKTGEKWETFVKKNLLDKLKMQATTTDHAKFLASSNKAFPHQWEGIDNIKEVPFEPLDVIVSAAGLSSNAHDMAKWLQFLLNKQSSHLALIKETLSPQIIAKPEMFFEEKEVWMEKVFFPNFHFLTYGMGWFVHDYKGITVCQNPGLTAGMNGLLALVPELNLGIAILSNLEGPFFSHSVLFHIIDNYLGDTNDWNQLFFSLREKQLGLKK